MKKKNNKGLLAAIITLIVLIVIVLGIGIAVKFVDFDELFSKTKTITKKEVTVTDTGIADAVEKVYDATVIVYVTESSGSGWGSGFVYKTDGDKAYILTNHHVVEGASAIEIRYTDGSSTTGTLVGSDQYNDVAVISVDKDSILAVAEVGSSEDLRLGDTVFAVGTPVSLSYSFTVTRGVLSGKNRLVASSSSSSSQNNSNYPFGYYSNNSNTSTTDTWYMSLLQIDASINSGNSGGPLCNSNGEVVGLTNSKLSSSVYSSSSSIENMGFAVSIEDALSVATEIEDGTYSSDNKPTLGVSMTTVAAAKYNNIEIDDSVTYGAVIVNVIADSAADKAGLKTGDVIISYNGNKIEDYGHLKYYLYKSKIGDKVTLKVIRDGKEKEITVTLKS